jgi:hypothetical protein
MHNPAYATPQVHPRGGALACLLAPDGRNRHRRHGSQGSGGVLVRRTQRGAQRHPACQLPGALRCFSASSRRPRPLARHGASDQTPHLPLAPPALRPLVPPIHRRFSVRETTASSHRGQSRPRGQVGGRAIAGPLEPGDTYSIREQAVVLGHGCRTHRQPAGSPSTDTAAGGRFCARLPSIPIEGNPLRRELARQPLSGLRRTRRTGPGKAPEDGPRSAFRRQGDLVDFDWQFPDLGAWSRAFLERPLAAAHAGGMA